MSCHPTEAIISKNRSTHKEELTMKRRSNKSIPAKTDYKPSAWERQLLRELHDPNRIYDARPAEFQPIKAVRLG
jgi:hypothetical protein